MKKDWSLINLNMRYFLKFGNRVFKCQIGTGGLEIAAKKVEGDKKTPIGKWYLEKLYYRSDRVLRPKFKKKNILKINHITKNSGWCDDINSKYYNKFITLDNPRLLNLNHEKLWRKDEAYDIIIVISHNLRPTIKKKGSAIFIHCSLSNKNSTNGCIALNKKDLVFLLKNLSHNTYIKI